MPSAISIVTLLTDFGDQDYFVPSVKGVILGINTQARIIDISHRIPPHSIEEAAYVLHSTYNFYPEGTVHVVVVDPGVGSARRPLLVTTSQHLFLAPDNGVLSYIFKNEPSVEVREIENKQFRLDSAGATFDGRDVFAPAAAWLTRGQVPGSFGRLTREYVTLPIPEPQVKQNVLVGEIVYIDHFGNLISNIASTDLDTLQVVTKRQDHSVYVGGVTIDRLKTHYAEGADESPDALLNSNGYLEVFMKKGRAVDHLGLKRGDVLEVK
jgi:S-adenosylmethionine hydrolase